MKLCFETPEPFPEMAQGEVRDLIIELLQKERASISDAYTCRRKEILDALLTTNKPLGNMAKVKEEIIHKVSTVPPERLDLKKFGFGIERNKHYKLAWMGKPYKLIIPYSPSDYRFMRNLLADLNHKFF